MAALWENDSHGCHEVDYVGHTMRQLSLSVYKYYNFIKLGQRMDCRLSAAVFWSSVYGRLYPILDVIDSVSQKILG